MTGNSEIKRRVLGIPFTREMAVAASRPVNPKTHTRRVLKPQPPKTVSDYGEEIPAFWRYDGAGEAVGLERDEDGFHVHYLERIDGDGEFTERYLDIGECPYGEVGDLLFIQEEWWHYKSEYLEMAGFPEGTITHLDDGRSGYFHRTYDGFNYADHPHIWTKREAKDMPRWASRITLEITDVRVERLQEISEGDARAEGAMPAISQADIYENRPFPRDAYLVGFRTLWDSIAKPGAKWEDDPWVWVIGFRRVEDIRTGPATATK